MPVQSLANGGITFCDVFTTIVVLMVLLLTGMLTIAGAIACPLLIAWLICGAEFFSGLIVWPQPAALAAERRRIWRLVVEEDANDIGGGGKDGDELRRQRLEDDPTPQTCRRRRAVLTLRYIGDLAAASSASPDEGSTDEPKDRDENELDDDDDDDVKSGRSVIVGSSQSPSAKHESAVSDSVNDSSVAVSSSHLTAVPATGKSTTNSGRSGIVSDRRHWQLRRSVERMTEASCLLTSYATSTTLLRWLPSDVMFTVVLDEPFKTFRKLMVKEDFDDVNDNEATGGQTEARKEKRDDDECHQPRRRPKLSIAVESEVSPAQDGIQSDFWIETDCNEDDDGEGAAQTVNIMTSKAVHQHQQQQQQDQLQHQQHLQQQQQPQQQQGIVLRRPASHW
jgi:hypothetical protein